MLIALGVVLGAVCALNIAVNPYGVWPISLFDPVYRDLQFNAGRTRTPYQAGAQHADTVLLGTSRVLNGMAIPETFIVPPSSSSKLNAAGTAQRA